MMPSSQIGLVGTGVAAGAAQTVNVVVMSVVPLLKVCDQPVVPSQWAIVARLRLLSNILRLKLPKSPSFAESIPQR
jgi:hypothetical protein